jgi:uncharacterized protein involved in outer membrane biogenesis
MKRLAVFLGGLIALIGFAVFLAPMLIPQSVLERHLTPLLAEATGLKLERAESIRLTVYPEPGIVVGGVAARLPVAEGRAPSVAIERITASFRPSALVDGRLELSRVSLDAPSSEIHLGAIDRGRTETGAAIMKAAFDTSAIAGVKLILAANRDAGSRNPVRLPAVEIVIADGSFTLQDEAGRAVTLSDADLTVLSPGGGRPLEAGGMFQLQGEPVTVRATAKPTERGFATQLSLDSSVGETGIEGTLVLDSAPSFTGAMRIALNSGAALAGMIGGNARTLARLDGSEVLGRLAISEARLEIRDGVISGTELKANLSALTEFRGGTRIAVQNLELHGGKGQLLVTYQPEGQGILGASFKVSNVDVLSLGAGASGFDWLSGRGDIDLQLAASGRSPVALASTLKGSASLNVAEGAVEGVDLPEMVDKAKAGELDSIQREAGKRTPFDRMQATYAIESGIAKTEDISVTGPNIEITGSGQTDFTRQRIKYKLNTRITSAAAAVPPAASGGEAPSQEPDAFVMPLVVKGDWDRPDIRPDISGAMKNKEALRGTAKLFGKSVEKFTGGGVKADEFGKMIDGLLGKKKKPKNEAGEAGQGEAQN